MSSCWASFGCRDSQDEAAVSIPLQELLPDEVKWARSSKKAAAAPGMRESRMRPKPDGIGSRCDRSKIRQQRTVPSLLSGKGLEEKTADNDDDQKED